MENCLTSKEMKIVDSYNIVNFISSFDLMKKAGERCFEFISKNFNKTLKFIVLTGSGNNGGDGFIIASKLLDNGYNVEVFEVEPPKSKEALLAKSLYHKEVIKEIKSDDLTVFIDSIFGTGLDKDLEEPYISLFNKINKMNKFKVVSIDIASGINADNGLIYGNAIISDITLAIGEYKLGHFLNNGKDYNKKVVKINIDLEPILEENDNYTKIYNKEDYKNLFINRKENSNKGDYGKVTLIGGSKEYIGSLRLAETAYLSLKLGVGYSSICFPGCLNNIYKGTYNELIYHFLDYSKKGFIKFNKDQISKILCSDVIAFGMGVGVNKENFKLIKYLFKNYEGILILDADALNTLAKYGKDILLKPRNCRVILTPHLKEFSRLTNLDIKTIKENRIEIGKEYSHKNSVILVLKDNVTTTINDNKVVLNVFGNNGLAKAGSGDILIGLIAGCLSLENEDIFKKVCLGSYLFGRSADILKINEGMNEYSITPSDTLKVIDRVIDELM